MSDIYSSILNAENLTALISLRRGRLKPFTEHFQLHFRTIKFNHVLSITLLLLFFGECDDSNEYLTEQGFLSQWKK